MSTESIKQDGPITSTEKTPRLRTMFEEAQERRKPLAEERDKVREELDSLAQNPRIAELRTRVKELNAVLAPIDNEIAALAKALGGRSITAEPGSYTK